MNLQHYRFSSPAGEGKRLRSTVEELESRWLFSCSVDGEPADQIEVSLSQVFDNGSSLPTSLAMGLGEHVQERTGAETVVTGINQQDLMSVSVLPLDDGRYVIAWVGDHQGIFGVYLRSFQSNGVPLGDPHFVHSVADPYSLDSIQVQAVATDEDQLAVLWRDASLILGQRFDCLLQPIGNPHVMVSDASYFEPEFQAIGRHDAGLVIAWKNQLGQTIAQGFHSTLNASHAAITLPISSGYDSLFELMKHPLADFAISYFEDGDDGPVQHFLPYSVEGMSVGNRLQFADGYSGVRPLLVLADSRLVSARPLVQSQPGLMDLVVEIHSETGQKLFEDSVIQSASLENKPQIVGLENGGFAISFVRGVAEPQKISVQQFNADGEIVGLEQEMNAESIQFPAKHLIAPLAGNGFAVQWMGYTLDGNGATLVTKPFFQGETPLLIQAQHSPDFDWPPEIRLDGIPADASLSRGIRDESGSWHLQDSDLESLWVFSAQPLPILNFTLSLVDPQSSESYADLLGTIGTDQDDLIVSSRMDHVFAGNGMDTLVVAGPRAEYDAIATIDGFQLRSNTAGSASEEVHPQVISVEFVQFADQMVTVDTLLNSPEPPSHSTSPSSGDETDTSETPPEFPDLLAGWAPQVDWQFRSIQNATVVTTVSTSMGNSPPLIDSSGRDLIRIQQAGESFEQPDKLPSKGPVARQYRSVVVPAGGDISVRIPPGKVCDQDGRLASRQILQMVAGAAESRVDLPPKAEIIARVTTSLEVASPMSVEPLQALGAVAISGQDSQQRRPEAFSSASLGMETVFDSEQLLALVAEAQDESVLSERSRQLIVGTSVVFAAGFSLAHVAWALRSTIVLTKMMSALSVWRGFDPLPLLMSLGTDDDDETLIDIATARTIHAENMA